MLLSTAWNCQQESRNALDSTPASKGKPMICRRSGPGCGRPRPASRWPTERVHRYSAQFLYCWPIPLAKPSFSANHGLPGSSGTASRPRRCAVGIRIISFWPSEKSPSKVSKRRRTDPHLRRRRPHRDGTRTRKAGHRDGSRGDGPPLGSHRSLQTALPNRRPRPTQARPVLARSGGHPGVGPPSISRSRPTR